jgi:pheromone a factor receptor
MALHYIVQGHRFDIIEDIGCQYTVYWSWPAFVLIYLPPLVVSLIGCIYGSLTIYWFLQRRSQFNDILTSSNSGVTRSRYLRLMGLSFTEMVFLTAAELYLTITNFHFYRFRRWTSWADVHSNWGHIGQVARVLITDKIWSELVFVYCISVVGSVCFFVFFGTGEEALTDYMTVIDFVRIKVFRMKPRQPKVDQFQSGSRMPSIKLPKGLSQIGAADSYNLEAKWPRGDDSPTEAAPAYSKQYEATASKLSVPVSMTDGSYGHISPTATQYTVSDRASVALSYDERADEYEMKENNDVEAQRRPSLSTPTHPNTSKTGDNAV